MLPGIKNGETESQAIFDALCLTSVDGVGLVTGGQSRRVEYQYTVAGHCVAPAQPSLRGDPVRGLLPGFG
jgi:hypothetical protein